MVRILALFFILLFVPSVSVAEGTTIKIGAILHLSGDQAMQGNAFREGIELAAHVVNEKGGIDGRKVKVIFEDSHLKPKDALMAAKKLISSDKIVAALNSSYLETMASGGDFEGARIPVITLWDSSEAIEGMGDYVFGIGVWTPSAGETAAAFSRDRLSARTAVIIAMENEWSQMVSRYFGDAFEAAGGKILHQFDLDPQTVDFRSIFTKARALKADVYFTPVTDHVVPFYRQSRELLGRNANIITSDIITEAHLAQSPASFEGIYQTQPQDPDGPATLEMARSYQEFFRKRPAQILITGWGYDGMMLLAEAMKRGGVSPENIKSELYKVKDYAGASGTISIDDKGSSRALERIFQIKNGKLERAQQE